MMYGMQLNKEYAMNKIINEYPSTEEYKETQYWNSVYSKLLGYRLIGIKWYKYPDYEGVRYDEPPMPILLFEKISSSHIIEVSLQQDPEGNGPGYMMGIPEDNLPKVKPTVQFVEWEA